MKKLTLTLLMITIMLCSVFVTGLAAGKVLHMYTAFDTEEAKYYIEAFEKETGIDVEWVRMSSGEVLARVEAEAANPQASLWHAGSNTSHINAASKGLLEPYKPNTDFELIDILHAEDWAWTGFYTGAIGFVSNVNFLKEHNVKAPTSWSQLLDPAFEDNIAMAYPYTSGTAYTTYATLVQMIGLEKTLDWWEEFDKHSIHQYTKSGTACIAMVGIGEVAVGIAFSHDIMAKGINKGYPVVMTFPEEGTGYEVGGLSLIKGGPEPELAKQFIDWCYTIKAQNLFQKYNRLPVNPKATVKEGSVTLDQVKLINYDHILAGQSKDEWVTAWRDRIGK
ncbi:MAG TPA: ABC transporter substrate-binding protein [Candidatus Atribacteria bacterium]|nr:ABC transporter substrate-binding protein [Candidatus Atribacteria bacterium]